MPTKDRKRYRVMFRLGGRESMPRHGGSFKVERLAQARKRWIAGELAALRVPDLRLLDAEPARAPTLGEAAETWRASRIDVAAQTAKMHRSDIARIFIVAPKLRDRPIDELDVTDVTDTSYPPLLLVMWTSTAARSASAGRTRRTTDTGSSSSPTISSGRCSRRFRRAKTATSRRRCSPT